MSELARKGYDHYEISNFAKPGFYSRHNTAYWQGIPYLGIGPGAHSFDGKNRQFNVSHNMKYMRGLDAGETIFEEDPLTQTDRINEYILISLRTKWGVRLDTLKNSFGFEFDERSREYLLKLQKEGLLEPSEKVLTLTNQGKLLADQIAEDLFIIHPD